MEKNAINCLFRFKEIQSGVYAFNGCRTPILYGAFPQFYAVLAISLPFGLSILIGMSTDMTWVTISLPIILLWLYSNQSDLLS